MKESFDSAMEAILAWEGGYVNDPNDPGGATKYGISKRAHPDVDISKLSKKQARKIYQRDYWEPCGCEELPAGLDLLVFDCAVNQGPGFAVRTLQQSVGAAEDGIFGPRTREAAESKDSREAIRELVARRGVRYGRLANFSRYGLGWMRRLADIHQRACNLVASKPTASNQDDQ